MKSEKRNGSIKKTKWLAEIGGLSYTVENQVTKEVKVIVQIQPSGILKKICHILTGVNFSGPFPLDSTIC